MRLTSKINILHLAENLSSLHILLLFTGFAFYHTLVLNHLIPSFLGGYFGLFSVLAFITMLPFLKIFFSKSIPSAPLFSIINIFAFLNLFLVTLIFSYYNGFYNDAVIQSFEVLIYWLSFMLIGFFFVLTDKTKLLKIFNYFTFFYVLYIVYYILSEGQLMLSFGNSDDFEKGEVSGYQGIARSFLIIALISTAFINNRVKAIFLALLFAFILFVIGARSEFYGFVGAILLYHSIMLFKFKSSFIAIGTLLSITFFLGLYYFDSLMESRQLQVLDLGNSSSWIARQDMKEFAINQIKNSPFLGEFGGHVKYQSVGTYAHNSLSGYVNYGLLFFILYMFLNIYAFIISLYKVIKNPSSKEWTLSFLITFVVLFLIITAKPVFWPITYLSLGIFIGARYYSTQSLKTSQ